MRIFDSILDKLHSLLYSVINLLPSSPFIYMEKDDDIARYLGYVNYFIPINFFISVLIPWLACIIVYYAYMAILRWSKAVGS